MNIRNLLAPFRKRSRALDEEMQFHLEKEVEANIAAGMQPAQARRQAMIAFGGVQQTRERVSEVGWTHFFEVLLQDGRYAWRLLRKSPLFTSVVVVTLAVGIGLNTAVFSLIDAVLFRALPARNPEGLVLVRWHAKHRPKLHGWRSYGECSGNGGNDTCSLSLPWSGTVRSQAQLFSGIAAFAPSDAIDLSGNGPATITNRGEYVSGDFFPVLGIKAALGRTLQPSDDTEHAAPVLILSYAYWKSTFGASPDVVGRSVRLNGVPFRIIGVAQQGFKGLAPANALDLWVPLSTRPLLTPRYMPRDSDEGAWWLVTVARLKDGVSAKRAQAALSLLFRNQTENGPKPLFTAADDAGITLQAAQEALTGGTRDTLQPLYILMMAVGLVLLIACANIAGLLLARSAARSREIAVRLTLGARRRRIVSQLLMESATLSMIGGAFGLLVGRWVGRLSVLLRPSSDSGPWPYAPQLDVRVLMFTLTVSVLTALLFGLAPAVRSLRQDLTPALKAGAMASQESGRRKWYSLANTLVVAQVTLAIVALVSAGMMVHTLRNLKRTDLGFDPHNVLTFSIRPSLAGYKPAQVDGLYHELQQKFAALPGVTSVSYSWFPLLSGMYAATDIHLPGTPATTSTQTAFLPVGPGFFSSMRIPLMSGRDFSSRDFVIAAEAATRAPGAPPDPKAPPTAALVNRYFAEKFFPGLNPLGQHFSEGTSDGPGEPTGPGYIIIGVVGDARLSNLRREIAPTMYVPAASDDVSFAVRSASDPQQLVGAIRQIVHRRDDNLALSRVITESEQIDNQVFIERMVAQFSASFAVLALLLACAGIYGLLAYEVTRRTREIGIRMAIGAQQNDVLAMVVRHGLLLAMAGAVIGMAASFGVSRLLQSLLYGVHAGDPATLVAVAVLLLLVSLVACWLPARRATKVDPLVALRYE